MNQKGKPEEQKVSELKVVGGLTQFQSRDGRTLMGLS